MIFPLSDTQYCDGLRGALIIRDREDPYLKSGDYDEDGDSGMDDLRSVNFCLTARNL